MRGAPRVFPLIFGLFPVFLPLISRSVAFPVSNFPTHQAMSARRAARFLAYFLLIFGLFPAYIPVIFLLVCDYPTYQALSARRAANFPLIFGLFSNFLPLISRLFPFLFVTLLRTKL